MRFINCCAIVLYFTLFSTTTVYAGSFGDSFKSWLLGSEAQASMTNHGQPKLDNVAERCMQCHDGVRATHIAVKDANSPMQFSNSGSQVNHPVGMYYDEYASKRQHQYTPRYALDPSIQLVDGKVSCISCHQMKGPGETVEFPEISNARLDETQPVVRASKDSCTSSNRLTVGPRETDLCLACHAM